VQSPLSKRSHNRMLHLLKNSVKLSILLFLCTYITPHALAIENISVDDMGDYFNVVNPTHSNWNNLLHIYDAKVPDYTSANADPANRCTGSSGTETNNYESWSIYKSTLAALVDDCGDGVYFYTYKDPVTLTEYNFSYAFSQSASTTVTLLSTTSTTTTECPTCTRIIDSNPGQGDTLATTSANKVMHITYYLNSDDYEAGKTYLKVTVLELNESSCLLFDNFLCSERNEVIYSALPIVSGEHSTYLNLTNLTATGTYEVWISAYQQHFFTQKQVPVNSGNHFYFSVGTTTARIGTQPMPVFADGVSVYSKIYGHIDCNLDWTNVSSSMECLWDYVWSTFVPNQQNLADLYQNQSTALMSIEPWGSAIRIVDVLMNDEIATGTVAISHTFNLAGQTQTINLDAGQGLEDAITMIRGETVSTIDGDPFDKFLTYWELLWYIMFGLWLIKTLFGEFGVSYGQEHESVWSGKVAEGHNIRNSKRWTKSESISNGQRRTTYHKHKKL